MNRVEPGPQSGFSLIELLVIIALVGVLTTLALLQFRTAKTDFQRQAIAREFKVYLERARFDSVKRRADTPASMAGITLNGPSSFTAAVDFNEDGTISPSERRLVDFAHRSNTQIQVTDAFNYPVTVLFNRRGHVTARDGLNNDVTPVFRICSDCSDASPDMSIISVSTSGTVAVLRTDQPTTMPTPTTANSNIAPIFNCYVLAANVNSSGCVPN